MAHLQPVYCAFIIGLYKLLGESVIAEILQAIYQIYIQEASEDNANIKKNCLHAFLRLYQLGALKAKFILGILIDMGNDLTLFTMDMITHFIKNAGFDLRKEEPIKLKEFLDLIEEKQKLLKHTDDESVRKRLEFLIEDLQNLKNNKKHSFYDASKEKIQPLITWLHNNVHVRSEMNEGPFSVEWAQLKASPSNPKWWGFQESKTKPFQRDQAKKIGVLFSLYVIGISPRAGGRARIA